MSPLAALLLVFPKHVISKSRKIDVHRAIKECGEIRKWSLYLTFQKTNPNMQRHTDNSRWPKAYCWKQTLLFPLGKVASTFSWPNFIQVCTWICLLSVTIYIIYKTLLSIHTCVQTYTSLSPAAEQSGLWFHKNWQALPKQLFHPSAFLLVFQDRL